MKLNRFRVTDFRSVDDSGWLDVDDVTALIGVNESGKTNLLLPLWKLKPARDGEIQPTSDYPKTKFGEIRDEPADYHFIEAEFDTGEAAKGIAEKAGLSEDIASTVEITRYFDGHYSVSFPKHSIARTANRNKLAETISKVADRVRAGQALKKEGELNTQLAEGLADVAAKLPEDDELRAPAVKAVIASVKALVPEEPAETSVIVPMVKQLIQELNHKLAAITATAPGRREGVVDAVVEAIPPFVYYSNYGNLPSARRRKPCARRPWSKGSR
ncbi:MAG: hypothetical protein AAGC81_15115 [Pseudomonadota bacterium]